MLFEFEIVEKLGFALGVVAVASPYLQFDHILMIVVVDDEVGASFVASLGFHTSSDQRL